MDCEKCKDRDDCEIYQELWLNTRDCCEYVKQERESYNRYRRIFVEFDRYTKKDRIFLDNDGECIKSIWDKIVNRNSQHGRKQNYPG